MSMISSHQWVAKKSKIKKTIKKFWYVCHIKSHLRQQAQNSTKKCCQKSQKQMTVLNFFVTRCPRRDSVSGEAKNVLDALENYTKANFHDNIPGKIRFQKKSGAGGMSPVPSLFRRRACNIIKWSWIFKLLASHRTFSQKWG